MPYIFYNHSYFICGSYPFWMLETIIDICFLSKDIRNNSFNVTPNDNTIITGRLLLYIDDFNLKGIIFKYVVTKNVNCSDEQIF